MRKGLNIDLKLWRVCFKMQASNALRRSIGFVFDTRGMSVITRDNVHPRDSMWSACRSINYVWWCPIPVPTSCRNISYHEKKNAVKTEQTSQTSGISALELSYDPQSLITDMLILIPLWVMTIVKQVSLIYPASSSTLLCNAVTTHRKMKKLCFIRMRFQADDKRWWKSR